jgi:hypothetical protein
MNTVTVASQTAIALNLFGALFFFFYKPAKGGSQKLPAIVFLSAVFFAALLLNWAAIDYYFGADGNPGGIFKFGATVGVTLKMFGFEWEWELCAGLARNNIWYSIAIILCFISAVLNTVLLVMRLLIKSLWNAVSVFFLAHSANKIWVITGTGVHQEALLESLTPEQKSTAIIIPGEINEEAKKEYLARGFLVINEKISADVLKKAGCFNARETILIAISDDDIENLETVRTVNSCLQTLSAGERGKLRFSARVMYTHIERAEYFAFCEGDAAGGKVQFFNPYEITARSFLFDNPVTRFIPSAYIDCKAARLTGAFDFLHVFIGFGKANRELMKQSITANQVLGMDYHALVIDTSLKNSQSAFMNQSRFLFASEGDSTEYFPAPKEKCRIEFVECNVLSKEMYDTVLGRVKKADASAVVISLGNVQASAETAMELRQQCYAENIEKETINIFVRAKSHAPIVAEDVLNSAADTRDGIRIAVFGFEDAILSLESIVNREMDILAKHIAAAYEGVPLDDYQTVWDKLSSHKRESNRYAALSVQVKLNLMGFSLKYDTAETGVQDKAVLREFQEAYGFERAQRLRAAKDVLSYIERDSLGAIADTARNNLARLEHQRWNAFHLVKGWSPMPKKMVASLRDRQDKRTKKHACITTFEGLAELCDMQASLECAGVPAAERDARFHKAKEKYDTMHYDCDLMDCFIDNLNGTNYRIVKGV